MGARSVINRDHPPKVFTKHYRRNGGVSDVERAFVQQFVADQPREISRGQTQALAKVLNRTCETVKGLINDARQDLASNIGAYVAAHKQTVDQALSNGDAKSLEVAARASQWAMESIAIEGVRVVDKAKSEDSGVRIQIGVNLGGLVDPNAGAKVITVQTPSLTPDLETRSGVGGGGPSRPLPLPGSNDEIIDVENEAGEGGESV